MQKKSLENILFGVTSISALLSYVFIYRAIVVPGTSLWLVPAIWVSIFVISLLLAATLMRSKLEVELLLAGTFLLSFFFAIAWGHLLIVILCIALALWGYRNIRHDLDLNIKIDLWKSLYTGKFKLILALSLLIASQYYFTVQKMGNNIKPPKFDTSFITKKIVEPILVLVNPDFKSIKNEGLTVDEYILKTQKENANGAVDTISLGLDSDDLTNVVDTQDLPQPVKEVMQKEVVKKMTTLQNRLNDKAANLILLEGRKRLSEMTGQEIGGQEKMSDIMLLPINKAVDNYFNVNLAQYLQPQIFALIFSVMVFLIIFPLGSLLSVLWFWIVILLFKLLVKMEIVKIEKISVERENIA